MGIMRLIYKIKITNVCKSMFKFNTEGKLIPIIWSRYYSGYHLEKYRFANNKLFLLFSKRDNARETIKICYEYNKGLIIYKDDEEIEDNNISCDDYKRLCKLAVIAYSHMQEQNQRLQNMFRFR